MRKIDLKTICYCYKTGSEEQRKFISDIYDRELLNKPWRTLTSLKSVMEYLICNSKEREELYGSIDTSTYQGKEEAKSYVVEALNYFENFKERNYYPHISVSKKQMDDGEYLGKVKCDNVFYYVYCARYRTTTKRGGIIFPSKDIARHFAKYFWYLCISDKYSVVE